MLDPPAITSLSGALDESLLRSHHEAPGKLESVNTRQPVQSELPQGLLSRDGARADMETSVQPGTLAKPHRWPLAAESGTGGRPSCKMLTPSLSRTEQGFGDLSKGAKRA